jgi:tRNA 5-methylaminomethyl-2-thiouridine biosynthesis bifunctional protein
LKEYEYIIVGAGVCGSTVAYELSKYSDDILLIDKLSNVSQGASGAAGAFLSPLLGKPNDFKDLVTQALVYSLDFYKRCTPEYIDNCGTLRIPKNEADRDKFQSYTPYMDFEYEKREDGYFFSIGSVVNTFEICKKLTKKIEKKFQYEVKDITFKNDKWYLDDQLIAKNLILTTGASIELIEELYFNIRPVWGQRIDIETSTCIDINYHKECSLSRTIQKDENTYIASIGATHHRFVLEKEINNDDTQILLQRANDIKQLQDVQMIAQFGGARASSVDYFPMVGSLIDAKKTLVEFPYLKNGTHVKSSRFSRYENLFVLNGVGGRGFVLAPFLAKNLVEYITKDIQIDENLTVDRLFKRWVKKAK